MLNKKKNNKGFTLVELLVVIAIIGILAVVALPALFKNIDKSKVASLESDISAIKSATISYTADKNLLPKESVATTADASISEIITNLNGELDSLSNPYKAVYTLNAIKGAAGKPDAGKDTGEVVLTIAFGSPLSSSAIQKIQADLGTMLPSAPVAAGKIVAEDGRSMKVKIIDAGGLTQATS